MFVHIGDSSSNQATTLESQMIHMIQELFGQTLNVVKRPASSPERISTILSCRSRSAPGTGPAGKLVLAGNARATGLSRSSARSGSSERHDEAVMPVTAKAKSLNVDRARRQISSGINSQQSIPSRTTGSGATSPDFTRPPAGLPANSPGEPSAPFWLYDGRADYELGRP